jgi:hypothetical protein
VTALSAGAIVLAWVIVQVAIIGYVSWLQPATTVAGVLVVFFQFAPAMSARPPHLSARSTAKPEANEQKGLVLVRAS